MTVYLRDPDVTILHGDVIEQLATLPAGSVDCVVTSPPYWGLRDYSTEGQLGLEPTPDEYITGMVAVFREVRRVLRDTGTLWLNIGGGFQDKQMDMIPVRLALALQQPYYTGRIRDERDRVWLAATIEAEGCLFIHKRKAGTSAYSTYTKKDGSVSAYARTSDTYGSGLEVSSTDRIIVERCREIAGCGSINEQTPQQNDRRKQTLYRWNLRTNECRDLMRELYPHLLAKRHEARLLIGCPSSGPEAERAHESLKAIHQGGTPDIDFAEPETMFERGWYLRSDIIWSKKPNPMPESVTDRPTKAHEYVFLLSKRPRYFFDQEAVREPLDRPDLLGAVRLKGVAGLDGQRGDVGRYSDYANPAGRNVRSVWEIATQPYPEAHFATYPEELVRRCILAGTSERGVCPECGKPWEREVERESAPREVFTNRNAPTDGYVTGYGVDGEMRGGGQKLQAWRDAHPPQTSGWRPSCTHNTPPIPATVLDPFMGSGTTGLVARKHGRRCVGIELNETYCDLAARRLAQQSLLAQ